MTGVTKQGARAERKTTFLKRKGTGEYDTILAEKINPRIKYFAKNMECIASIFVTVAIVLACVLVMCLVSLLDVQDPVWRQAIVDWPYRFCSSVISFYLGLGVVNLMKWLLRPARKPLSGHTKRGTSLPSIKTKNKTERRPRSDPESGEPYASLSVAVRYFYPDTDYDRMGMENSLPKEYSDGFLSGSVVENLNLPPLENIVNCQTKVDSFDIDVMVPSCVNLPLNCKLRCLTHPHWPGFCFVLVIGDLNNPQLEQHVYRVGDMAFLSNQLFSETFPDMMDMIPSNIPTYLTIYEMEESPALTMTSDYGNSFDHVPCFPVPWPKEAKAWRSRKRDHDWPSPGTITDIYNDSLYIVSKPHPTSIQPLFQWRFSFSKAEIKLVKTLNNMQKISYKVFKTLIKYHMKTRDFGIQSYLLKTTLFWACEQSEASSWDLDRLGEKFLQLFDKLLDFLKKHELPHYFIPDNNLINHISCEEVKKWIIGVEFIRKNPLQCMYDFYSEYQIITTDVWPMPMGTNLRYFYQAGLDILREKPITLDKLAANIEECLQYFGFPYATWCRHETVLSIAMTELNIVSFPEEKLQCLMSKDVLIGELYILITAYQNYLELVPRLTSLLNGAYELMPDQCRHSEWYWIITEKSLKEYTSAVIQGEIACFYFQMHQNTKEREGLIERAERHFRDCCSSKSCPLNVKVKYAQFLLLQKHYGEALELLLNHPEYIPDLMYTVVYNRYTDKNVEATLRMAHRYELRDIDYSAVALAEFLLAICYKEACINVHNNYLWRRSKDAINMGRSHYYGNHFFFQACFLLRYGNVCEALCALTNSTHAHPWLDSFYKYYCVAQMVYLLTAPDIYPLLLSYRISNILKKFPEDNLLMLKTDL